MQNAKPNLITRDDTLLGVCEALGEDFGFNPLWLRISLAVGLLWNPMAMIGAYLGLGVVVLATRLLIPARRQGMDAAAAEQKPLEHQNDDHAPVMAQAA